MESQTATPDRPDRARAALLAHACGDRFGAPLEFVRSRSVRTREVNLGNWTDDTHMSIYLGEAIVAHGPGPLDPDRFGAAVGEAFVRWLHDPLTPSTAPGGTCLAGAGNFERDRDWKTSGVLTSDGCGAVMRVVPVALAFHGEDLLEAARVSAMLTHAHPNALEAAMAGAWLVRRVLETGRWGNEAVEAAARGLEGPWSQGGEVAASLRAAVAWARRGEDWLDEGAIPPGDGGWRSGSALGLAVAAALRWPHDLGLAVEKAARIQGDSDSVACLVGALLGAALGTEAIPPQWLATLPRRTEITDLADHLVAQGRSGSVSGDSGSPLVVVGDLHGHLDLFDRLLATMDRHYPQARIVTLGDYVDNGPQIPALLDRLIDLKAKRPDRFFPILGNHDLALLRALGWPGDAPDRAWYDRWRKRYWNPGLGTPQAYDAHGLKGFEHAFPLAHYRFLAAMPWHYDDGEHFCVHAGLHRGPIGPQRDSLAAKQLPAEKLFLPDAIRSKDLATVHDPAWERVVVSSHTYLPGQAVFSAPRRICVSATSDHGDGLLAVVLPERRCWRGTHGEVVEVSLS
jgi:ADP-ribosylglycohydrolase